VSGGPQVRQGNAFPTSCCPAGEQSRAGWLQQCIAPAVQSSPDKCKVLSDVKNQPGEHSQQSGSAGAGLSSGTPTAGLRQGPGAQT